MEKMVLQPKDTNEIRLGHFILRGKKLYIIKDSKNGKEEEVYLANASKIKSITRTVETGQITLEIEYYSYDRWETLKISKGKLLPSELSFFLDKGMDIGGYKAKHVFQFLDFHEKSFKPTYVHQKLGWMEFQEEMTFRLNEAIQSNKRFSTYEGRYSIKPKGSEEEWKQIVREEVVGYPPLEAIVAASFAAPIIAWLNIEQKGDIDTLLWNCVGNSSGGKTTAAMLAVSAFGNPNISTDGLVQSFNGTGNALQAILAGNFGVPIAFDEVSISTFGKQALTSFIYKLAQNKDKARLNKESKLISTDSWCTVVFFTGEVSILAQTKNNVGLKVRLFEFKNIQWTKDAAHSERIKVGVLNNYGHAGATFVEHLIHRRIDEIEAKWSEFKSVMFDKMPETNYRARISNKFASILTGAFYANEALGLSLSIDRIADFLVEQELDSMTNRDLAPRFYDLLRQKIIQYRKHFKVNNNYTGENQEIWGKIEIKNKKTYCYILTHKYEELAQELGFADANILLDELKKMEVLKHDANKLQTKKAVFKKEETELRERSLAGKEYNPKGDYTVCIVYEGDMLEDYFIDKDALENYNPNNTKIVRNVSAVKPKNELEAMTEKSKSRGLFE
ncbi:DUF927 domain-containing protein [Lysinibacillus xylanilyticus]|uniref:DUF927 domain-containing protein n=1 Tax=Lysinibacillus xylanilyticus TaxID=582475 RepID=UPI003D0837F4